MQSLYFLLPLLVIYELGASTYLWEQGRQHTAHRLMLDFLDLFGVTGRHLPALVVVAVLVSMHLVRRRDPVNPDPWRPEPKLYLAMAFEAMVLALPLFVLTSALFRAPAAAGFDGDPAGLLSATSSSTFEQWKASLVISIGAGVYEELAFRLVAIALVGIVTKEILALPEEACVGSAVVLSSAGFALIHFGHGQAFDAGRFLFYFVTGVYFAAVYLGRGFGLVVATHTLYDVMVFSKHLYQNG